MANAIRGERDVVLNGIKYTLRLTMSVIAEFQEMRDKDFMAVAVAAVNVYAESMKFERALDRAEAMTSVVSLDDAATLIYLAAKESNSQVEFEEIQDALLSDFNVTNDALFYPAIFADLCLFAVMGKDGSKKKAKGSKAG